MGVRASIYICDFYRHHITIHQGRRAIHGLQLQGPEHYHHSQRIHIGNGVVPLVALAVKSTLSPAQIAVAVEVNPAIGLSYTVMVIPA